MRISKTLLLLCVGLGCLHPTLLWAESLQIISSSGDGLASRVSQPDEKFDVQVRILPESKLKVLQLQNANDTEQVIFADVLADETAAFHLVGPGRYLLKDLKTDSVIKVWISPSKQSEDVSAGVADDVPAAVYALGIGGLAGTVGLAVGGSSDNSGTGFESSTLSSSFGGSSTGSGAGSDGSGFVLSAASAAPNPGSVSPAPGTITNNGTPAVPGTGGFTPGNEPDSEAAPIPPSPTPAPPPSGS